MRGTEQIEVRKILFLNLSFWFECDVVTEELESKFYTHLVQAIKIQNMSLKKKFANQWEFVEICQVKFQEPVLPIHCLFYRNVDSSSIPLPTFFHNRFTLASLWISSLTHEVSARHPKRSPHFQTSLLYVINLISPSRSISSFSSHVISVIPSHIGISPSKTVDQLPQESAFNDTSCLTFLAQDLIPYPANVIKSNWTVLHLASFCCMLQFQPILALYPTHGSIINPFQASLMLWVYI